MASLRASAGTLAPVVGTRAVTGPALTVTLGDAERTAASLPEGFAADDIVVHQQDVENVVALWAAGAEAMMLMDQRFISTSAVRCVGNTLILQGRVYSPPYVIQAMGDQWAMREALDKSRFLSRSRPRGSPPSEANSSLSGSVPVSDPVLSTAWSKGESSAVRV